MSADRGPAAEVAELAERLGTAMAAPGATARAVAELVAPAVQDDGAPLGLHARPGRPGIAAVAVTRRWGSEEPDTAEITLDPELALSLLEAQLGPARAIPRAPHGGRTVVLGTVGAEWTVFAALEDSDLVRSVTVRRDN